jgi:aspartate carbamoyltransferase catalytic subunit
MIRETLDKPDIGARNGENHGTTRLRHVLESQQFTVPLLMELFARSRGMERVVARGGSLDYQKKIMATLFYQPSTRTRLSF